MGAAVPGEGGALTLPSALTLNLRAVSDGISLSQTISAALKRLFDGLQELAGAAQQSLEAAETRQERLALNEALCRRSLCR